MGKTALAGAPLGAFLLWTAAIPSDAFAQSTAQVDGAFAPDVTSVQDRSHPEYAAIGKPVGSFLLFPRVKLEQSYDDNVFATANGRKSDEIQSVSPSILLQSQWSSNALSLDVHASSSVYDHNHTENNTTYGAELKGRADFVDATKISVGAVYDHLTDPRSDAASPAAAKTPDGYDQAGADLSVSHEADRFRFSGSAQYRDYTYDSVQSVTGGTIDERYRNNQFWQAALRGDYAFSPSLAVYTTAITDNWVFDRQFSPDGVDRNSSNDQVDVGADFEVNRLVRGQVQIGYLYAHFSQPNVRSSGGLSLKGRVEYFLTPLVTLTINGERSVQASGVIGSPATISTTAGVQADYELLRNLIFSASAQRLLYVYQGLDRSDVDLSARVGVKYSLTRWLGVGVNYIYYNQASTGAARGPNFADNRIEIGLTLQY